MTDILSVKEKLKQLKLSAIAQNLDSVLEQAQQKNLDILVSLERLVDFESEQRWQNAIKNRYRQSRLNEKVAIDQFDFDHHVSRKKQKQRILNLMNLEFVRQKMDVILIGNPGVGKTFLAKAACYAACNANFKVLFTTAADMINNLIAAEADRSLLKKFHYYQSPALLCVDEIGYLPLGRDGSNLFFQVMSNRHQQRSSILTTNLPFADWGKVFDSTSVAVAVADRIVQNSEVFILEGESYRRKGK